MMKFNLSVVSRNNLKHLQMNSNSKMAANLYRLNESNLCCEVNH